MSRAAYVSYVSRRVSELCRIIEERGKERFTVYEASAILGVSYGAAASYLSTAAKLGLVEWVAPGTYRCIERGEQSVERDAYKLINLVRDHVAFMLRVLDYASEVLIDDRLSYSKRIGFARMYIASAKEVGSEIPRLLEILREVLARVVKRCAC